MGDFPPEWNWTRDLVEGGQGHTYLVERSDGLDPRKYVFKRLKNPKRRDYFDREIRACIALEQHPNVLKILDYGETPKGKPYLVTDYCEKGSISATGSIQALGDRESNAPAIQLAGGGTCMPIATNPCCGQLGLAATDLASVTLKSCL